MNFCKDCKHCEKVPDCSLYGPPFYRVCRKTRNGYDYVRQNLVTGEWSAGGGGRRSQWESCPVVRNEYPFTHSSNPDMYGHPITHCEMFELNMTRARWHWALACAASALLIWLAL